MKKKFIGVTHLDVHFPTKQDVLLFDHIAVGSLSKTRADIHDLEAAAAIDYLTQEGVVIDAFQNAGLDAELGPLEQQYTDHASVNAILSVILSNASKEPRLLEQMSSRQSVQDLVNSFAAIAQINRQQVSESVYMLFKKLHGRLGGAQSTDLETHQRDFHSAFLCSVARAKSVSLSGKPEFDAVPLIHYPHHDDLLMPSARENVVANVVIKNMPTPSPDTPWEAVMDFRGHPDTQRRLFDFRYWMGKVAKELAVDTTSVSELEQELDYLTHEYTEHMKLAKLKIESTTAETLITLIAEVAEDVIKLKFKDAVKAVFSLRHRKIALLEAERQAPGREIAYLVEAARVFGNS
ncbi:MAG: hypothetical protein OEV49_12440 [candidate division Zixibacteria bacterium]|nr:hypothetical protein [candidate division Zixibacteria bacterium]MDH3935916.1 hypothetical protein [candidate division Zixibacteria bacterium]